MKRTTALRALLQRPRATLLCGVHDGLSAGIAERAGFDALWASGFCISASKRLPDVGLITMTEHLAATREIHNATALPVVADVDDGYGDAVAVTRMVREYEAAGIAGVCMEDNAHPKRNSLYAELSRRLVDADAFAAKIRAAKETQRDADFTVIARTEALVADLGLDEAMRRATAYADAGADMILVHSKDRDPVNLFEFSTRWKGRCPLVAVPTKYPQVSADELHRAGYVMVIFANHGMRAAVAAMDRVFRTLVETRTLESVEGEIASLKDIFPLVGFDEFQRIEARYMGPDGGAPDKDEGA